MKAEISTIKLEFTPDEYEKLREEFDDVLSRVPGDESVKEVLSNYPMINLLLQTLRVEGLPF